MKVLNLVFLLTCTLLSNLLFCQELPRHSFSAGALSYHSTPAEEKWVSGYGAEMSYLRNHTNWFSIGVDMRFVYHTNFRNTFGTSTTIQDDGRTLKETYYGWTETIGYRTLGLNITPRFYSRGKYFHFFFQTALGPSLIFVNADQTTVNEFDGERIVRQYPDKNSSAVALNVRPALGFTFVTGPDNQSEVELTFAYDVYTEDFFGLGSIHTSERLFGFGMGIAYRYNFKR